MNDRLFLAIAKKLGIPSAEALKKLESVKGGATLWTAAIATRALTEEQKERFLKIARKAKKGEAAEAEANAVGSAPTGASPKATKSATPSAKTNASATPSKKGVKTTAPVPPEPEAEEPGATEPEAEEASETEAAATAETEVEATETEGATETAEGEDAPGELAPAPNGVPVVAIAAVVVVLLCAIAAVTTVIVLRRGNKPAVVAQASPSPSAAPVAVNEPEPVPDPSPSPSPVKAARSRVDRDQAEKATRTIHDAEKLEADNKEDEAIALYDVVIEDLTDVSACRILIDARSRMLDRLRDRLSEVATLIDTGRLDDARKLYASLKDHYPEALKKELEAAQRQIAVATEAAAKPAAEKPKPVASGPATPQAGPKPADVARLASLRKKLHRPIADLDPVAAKALLDKTDPFDDPVLAAGFALDKKRVEALERLSQYVQAGFRTKKEQVLEVELRVGPKLEAIVVKVTGLSVVLSIDGAEYPPLPFGMITPDCLLAVGLLAVKTDPDWYWFGRGVMLAGIGDKAGAIESLTKAASIPEALLFRKQLEKDETLLGPVQKFDNSAFELPIPEGSDPNEKPITPDERKAAVEKKKADGKWNLAFMSKYYDFFSNGPIDEVKQLATMMDLACDEYKRIFDHKQPIPKPFTILLYKNHAEFQNATKVRDGVGGFYDGHKIVAFHGNYGSLTPATTLLHEGTHQFQGVVFGKNMWKAKRWFIEGLAVYFEASQVDGKHLITDVIPPARLAGVQRDIRSNNVEPLADLIRLPPEKFGAREYGYAWSLIYFFVHGTKGGLQRFKKYFEGVKEGKDGVKLFEELFDKPIDEIEGAWRNWVINLR